jgi:hypothetical protein
MHLLIKTDRYHFDVEANIEMRLTTIKIESRAVLAVLTSLPSRPVGQGRTASPEILQ